MGNMDKVLDIIKDLSEEFDDIEIKADKQTQSIGVYVDTCDGLDFKEEVAIYT